MSVCVYLVDNKYKDGRVLVGFWWERQDLSGMKRAGEREREKEEGEGVMGKRSGA